MKNRRYILVTEGLAVATAGVVGAILLHRHRVTHHRWECMNNLRQIDSCKELWASWRGAAHTNGTPVVWEEISIFLKGGRSGVYCPDDPDRSFDTSYDPGVIGEAPKCRINPGTHVFQGEPFRVHDKPSAIH